MIENEKIRAEVERRYKWYQDEITKYMPHMVPDYEAKKEECKSILDFIDSPQEEPVSEDLEEAAKNSGQRHFPDEDNIWARPNYEAEHAELAFKEGANWQKNHLWKDAQGDDLPEIDREVIVLTQPYPLEGNEYTVSFAHRPNPEGWDGKSLSTGKIEHFTPKTYDKCGWNIPDVKYWLDAPLPK